MHIIPLREQHHPALSKIYADGIATGKATFETDVPIWEVWNQSHLSACRIAAMENGQMLGWAALSPVSSRCVYGGVAELSVYVAASARGKGVGKFLLSELITQSEAINIWTLQAGIFTTNKASIALHEKCGFRIIGHREKIGKLGDHWMDNTLMERRSTVVGL